MEAARPPLRRDLLFGQEPARPGPEPGQPFPAFDLETTDGHRIRNAELEGRPVLIALASCTCAITAQAAPLLKWLHARFGDRVVFLSVYVREARPNRRYTQPATFEQKRAHALDFQRRHRIPWVVAVDDVENPLHRALDGRSSSVYLLDRAGAVLRHVPASNDLPALRRGLAAALGSPPTPAQIPDEAPVRRPRAPAARGPDLRERCLIVPSSTPAPPPGPRPRVTASLVTAGALAAAGLVAWRWLVRRR